jgi:hypothetical protein
MRQAAETPCKQRAFRDPPRTPAGPLPDPFPSNTPATRAAPATTNLQERLEPRASKRLGRSRDCTVEPLFRTFLLLSTPRKGQHFRCRLAGKSGTAGALQPAFNRRGCSAPHAKSFQPASQLIHLPSGQLFNGVFNFTDAAHSWNLARDGRDRQDPKPPAAPSFQFRVVTADPDDNIFTDCAITAGADYLLTEDAHFAPLAEADYR